METKVLKPTAENIMEAADIIRKGGLVAFPTETVYGLGGNALDEKAAGKIYAPGNGTCRAWQRMDKDKSGGRCGSCKRG